MKMETGAAGLNESDKYGKSPLKRRSGKKVLQLGRNRIRYATGHHMGNLNAYCDSSSSFFKYFFCLLARFSMREKGTVGSFPPPIPMNE